MTSSSTNHATHGRLNVDNQGQGVAPPRKQHVSAFFADRDAPRHYFEPFWTTQSDSSGHYSPNRRSAYDQNYDDVPDFTLPWDQLPMVYFPSFSYEEQYNAMGSASGSGPYQENTGYSMHSLYPASTATYGGTTQFTERLVEDGGADYSHPQVMSSHPTDFMGVGAFVPGSIAQPILQARINAAPQVALPRTSEQRPSSDSANDEVPAMSTPTALSPVQQTLPLRPKSPDKTGKPRSSNRARGTTTLARKAAKTKSGKPERAHKESPATGTTTYACTELDCDKVYKSAGGLSKHKMQHLGRIVRCGHRGCNYESNRPDQTKAHFVKAHPGVDVPPHLEPKKRGKTVRRQSSAI